MVARTNESFSSPSKFRHGNGTGTECSSIRPRVRRSIGLDQRDKLPRTISDRWFDRFSKRERYDAVSSEMGMKVLIADYMVAFHRAHEDVIAFLGGTNTLVRSQRVFRQMNEGWKKVHNVNIASDWQSMEFQSEEDFILFLMRYG